VANRLRLQISDMKKNEEPIPFPSDEIQIGHLPQYRKVYELGGYAVYERTRPALVDFIIAQIPHRLRPDEPPGTTIHAFDTQEVAVSTLIRWKSLPAQPKFTQGGKFNRGKSRGKKLPHPEGVNQ
jgi:hypothetical protein